MTITTRDGGAVYRSPFPDSEIPNTSIAELVLRRAREFGEKAALVDGPTGRTISYNQLADDVRRTAVGLSSRGFGKGDVFAIYSPNLPEFATAFLAVTSAGGIVTTINPLATAAELKSQLLDSGASHLLTTPALIDTARAATGGLGKLKLWTIGETAGATPFASLLDHNGDAPDVEINPREDIAVLPYSSGTTGLPKGVMLTHYNLVAHEQGIDGIVPIGPRDTLIAVLPFFHIYGMMVIMAAGLSRGATIVTMPRFDLAQFLGLLQDFRVTSAFLVPPIVLALAKHPLVDDYDLSSLRTIFSGAAPLSGELAEQCAARIGCAVVQGYGMTETSPVTHLTPEGRARSGSIGVCARFVEARVVDPETGRTLPPGEQGELWVRGPQVMRGYLNQPDATAQTIVEGGWLRTGDIARADPDGYFYIVDRLKELIKYKGYQVAPAELEAVLLVHPRVSDAAVIGSPDVQAGEVPKAFVVRNGNVTETELIAHVAAHVAPYKKVRMIEFVDAVPKSASGKILRRILIERERERAART